MAYRLEGPHRTWRVKAPAAEATGAGDGRRAVVPAAYDSITEATSQRGERNRLLSEPVLPICPFRASGGHL